MPTKKKTEKKAKVQNKSGALSEAPLVMEERQQKVGIELNVNCFSITHSLSNKDGHCKVFCEAPNYHVEFTSTNTPPKQELIVELILGYLNTIPR